MSRAAAGRVRRTGSRILRKYSPAALHNPYSFPLIQQANNLTRQLDQSSWISFSRSELTKFHPLFSLLHRFSWNCLSAVVEFSIWSCFRSAIRSAIFFGSSIIFTLGESSRHDTCRLLRRRHTEVFRVVKLGTMGIAYPGH